MPKADNVAAERRKANYKKNAYTQAWAEGRYTKAKGKGKGTAEDGEEGEDEIKREPLIYAIGIRAPGIVVNCMRGKEKKCGVELVAIFNSIADELYPDLKLDAKSDDESEQKSTGVPLTIEEELQAELAGLKKEKEKKVYRFSFVQTKVECFVYLHVKKPIDPNRIVEHYLKSVEATGLTQTRFTQRLIPCQAVCGLEVDTIVSTCRELVAKAAERVKADKGDEHEITWRMNYNSKTDSKIKKDDVLLRAREMSDLKVTMKGADIVVGIEIYRGIAAIGVMTEFDRFRKYNPREISLAFNKEKKSEHGRVIPAGREGETSTKTAVTEDETTDTQPEEQAADKPVPADAPIAHS